MRHITILLIRYILYSTLAPFIHAQSAVIAYHFSSAGSARLSDSNFHHLISNDTNSGSALSLKKNKDELWPARIQQFSKNSFHSSTLLNLQNIKARCERTV